MIVKNPTGSQMRPGDIAYVKPITITEIDGDYFVATLHSGKTSHGAVSCIDYIVREDELEEGDEFIYHRTHADMDCNTFRCKVLSIVGDAVLFRYLHTGEVGGYSLADLRKKRGFCIVGPQAA